MMQSVGWFRLKKKQSDDVICWKSDEYQARWMNSVERKTVEHNLGGIFAPRSFISLLILGEEEVAGGGGKIF